jgi:hypothetical protein
MKLVELVQHVTEFLVVTTALREMRAVGFAQRADQRIAVLFAVCPNLITVIVRPTITGHRDLRLRT